MLRIFAEGLLGVYLICCFISLVVGNIYISWSWIKNLEKMGVTILLFGNLGRFR